MFSQTFHNNKDEAQDRSLLRLPLNLVALIIRHVCSREKQPRRIPINVSTTDLEQIEQPADLARVCRTCRTLHFMTLHQLYTNVSIRSFDHIRYSQQDGRAEGCGMASPFAMALNALVCRNIAGSVKTFKVLGKWKDHEVKECAKAGRVPDGDMMLNSLVRIAVERMTALRQFRYVLGSLRGTPILTSAFQLGIRYKDVTYRMAKPRSIYGDTHGSQISFHAGAQTNRASSSHTTTEKPQDIRHRSSLLRRRYISALVGVQKSQRTFAVLEPSNARSS